MAKRKEEPEIEVGLQMAPMINVMLVLLAAFVATTGAVQKEFELGVKVPGRDDAKPTKPNTENSPINVEIDANGAVFFNKRAMDPVDDKEMPRLKSSLQRATELFGDQAVIIRPHADTPHERVIDVLNACSHANVKNLSFGELR
ncbi:MAG: ExbD/TolR family protein [Candidatus Methylacidiphilales bacterium]